MTDDSLVFHLTSKIINTLYKQIKNENNKNSSRISGHGIQWKNDGAGSRKTVADQRCR
ncbi:protein of unknown function [Chryseobacterium sp. JV274]|nr:protein of unknown function [Chryseobacterium sp. JV274]